MHAKGFSTNFLTSTCLSIAFISIVTHTFSRVISGIYTLGMLAALDSGTRTIRLKIKGKKNYKEGKSKLSLDNCFATPSVVGPDNWTCEILNESECYNNNLRKAW